MPFSALMAHLLSLNLRVTEKLKIWDRNYKINRSAWSFASVWKWKLCEQFIWIIWRRHRSHNIIVSCGGFCQHNLWSCLQQWRGHHSKNHASFGIQFFPSICSRRWADNSKNYETNIKYSQKQQLISNVLASKHKKK